jgi:hypothetical protein
LIQKTFYFNPRIQRLNTIEGETRSSVHFIEKLQKFYQHIGAPLTKIPTLNGKPIDLFRLRKEVMKRGGHEQVEKTNSWRLIARVFSRGMKLATSSSCMKSAYYKYIFPYEEYIKEHGEFEEQMESVDGIGEIGVEKLCSKEEPTRRTSSRIKEKSKGIFKVNIHF